MLPYYKPSSQQIGNGDNNWIQQQNYAMENELAEKVQELHRASLGLRAVIKKDKSNWDKMGDLFGNASDILNETVKKFDVMKKTGGINIILYLACFMFVVFMLFYWIFF